MCHLKCFAGEVSIYIGKYSVEGEPAAVTLAARNLLRHKNEPWRLFSVPDPREGDKMIMLQRRHSSSQRTTIRVWAGYCGRVKLKGEWGRYRPREGEWETDFMETGRWRLDVCLCN